jgi:hypothetical protein
MAAGDEAVFGLRYESMGVVQNVCPEAECRYAAANIAQLPAYRYEQN